VIHSIRSAADAMGISLADLLTQTTLFMHGSTVVDNTILTRESARTGLITTRRFEDTVLMTRGAYGRWGGLTEDRIKHPVKTERAPPLVAPDCIVGVPERADYKGAIIQELDEAAAEAAIRPDRRQGHRSDCGVVSVVILQRQRRAKGQETARAHRFRHLLHAVE
jgi:N-methylhydantoinase A